MQCLACRRDMPATSRSCPYCGARSPTPDAVTVAGPERRHAAAGGATGDARFIPGTLLADRYRIVAFLARGGMGDVYRADDLKLGQPVALKLLMRDLDGSSDALARFHQEVRLAREVSHPYVCRVYDIGEANGWPFLSMEYVDGEDLASLLRRVGRLLPDKALELARQICAGLAAAHDRGVLHGDLKPANVLIDGRGRARIADFGLAGLIDVRRDPGVVAGTPAYMAPEQFTGQQSSVQTDVYALGLVLYEMFTGKRAVNARAGPPRPSSIIADFDPAVERLILSCLQQDPADRPSSVLAVAAALPGGDPLAAALAAGETPSPDMVAASGDVAALAPIAAAGCIAAIAIGLVAIVSMSPQTTVVDLMDKDPEVLIDRARTIARNLGYTDRPTDEAFGYESDVNTGQTAALSFWYRRSAHALMPANSTLATIGEVTRQQPPPTDPGMVTVVVDPAGRLTGLTAVARQMDSHATVSDWAPLFEEAGLSLAAFTRAGSSRIPPVYADARAAWDGVLPHRPEIAIRVEAATAGGRPVYFAIDRARAGPLFEEPVPDASGVSRALGVVGACVGFIAIAATLLLARRNLRLGRGDRPGAFRVSVFLAVVTLLYLVLRAHHVSGSTGEQDLIVMQLAVVASLSLFMWTVYIALEPHVRRTWPEMMIGWARLLTGRIRDPRVGRDILVGVLDGIFLTLALQLAWASPHWFG